MPGTATAHPTSPLRLWGLDAHELHDAYLASHGVHCVRRGSGVEPQAGADLFLLFEPAHFVVFDLPTFSEVLILGPVPIHN